jgi:hypothetical protein
MGYKSDDAVRITGHLDGETGPLVALYIPDKAYLGWGERDDPDREEGFEGRFLASRLWGQGL